MKTSEAIHYFSGKETVRKNTDPNLLGIRGRQASEFAEMKLPILPGFILDAEIAPHLRRETVTKDVMPYLEKFAKEMGKTFGDPTHPMLLKLVISPNLAIANYPALHNFGLAKDTIEGFAGDVGGNFASHEVYFMLKGVLTIEKRRAELEDRAIEVKAFDSAVKEISAVLRGELPGLSGLKIMEKYAPLLPEGFFDSAAQQLEIMLCEVSAMLELDDQNNGDTAIIVQPMVYGNSGKNSCSGNFFTRNIVTGEKKLQGRFFEGKFDDLDSPGKDINLIDRAMLNELQTIAWNLEDETKDIRQIRFTVENGKLWLIEQRPVEAKSTISLVKLLLDLNQRKIVDDVYVVSAVKPSQLNEILHSVIDLSSVKNFRKSDGGIAGAPGAAVGRVYFSADALIDAQRTARQQGEDSRCILLMPATYAGDVKAIEVATGVLSNEGGYSAHASVVSRQYGKVSLVRPDMVIRGKKAVLDGVTINEGDYISLNVPYYGESTVYFGQVGLIDPDPESSGLLEFIALTSSFIRNFHVRANADSPFDAELALRFGAEGIGLCRTEHMFFNTARINVFRDMLLSDDTAARTSVLKELQKMQTEDFYGIFKAMSGHEVTIRLLDSPLHEFLPHNPAELAEFMDYLAKKGGKKISKAEIQEKIDAVAEINPMLGHRGCRIAISYPEIYEMQIRAVFEAAYKLKKEGFDVRPEIMVPIIMNYRELKQIVYGKKIEGHAYQGIVDIEKAVRAEFRCDPVDFRIGTMIELPAAALGAGEIARYAQFFSFGTNDLTQTTLGLSRDDFNSFMPDYTMYDLVDGNPFAVLDPRVRELIELAVRRGTEARPNLVKGLCGEHGARPENIKFCMDSGLDYVSCSSYSVPIALLSIAQLELETAKKEGRAPYRRPVRRPAEKPAAKSAGRTAVKSAGKAAAKPAGKPAAKAAAKPAGKTAAKDAKAGKAAAKPAGKSAAKPAGKTAAKAAAKPAARRGAKTKK